jgi:hypothetical protein
MNQIIMPLVSVGHRVVAYTARLKKKKKKKKKKKEVPKNKEREEKEVTVETAK